MNIFDKLSAHNESQEWDYLTKNQSNNSNSEFFPIEDEKSGGNIFERIASQQKKKDENKFSFLDYGKDIAQQVLKKGISGITGAYGNILETLGLQSSEGQSLPGQSSNYKFQRELLDKMNRGEQLTPSEIILLSGDEGVPDFTRLPTSKEVEKGIEYVTGIGEGKTSPGRISGRGAGFIGEGLATGGGIKTLVGMGLGGIGGQGLRESGGAEALASAIEIGSSLAPSVITKNLSPLSKTGKDIVKAGRKIGLEEKQIAPLIQSEKKLATISPIARKGEKTKSLFGYIKENLGDSYNRLKSLPEAKKKLPNSEQINLRREFSEIRNDLSKTLAPSPDKQSALDYIENSLNTIRNTDVTPEHLVNFWQDINKSVKWNSINGGKKALARLKKPVSDTLKKVSPKLEEDFDLTNQLYTKYSTVSKKLKPNIVDSFINKGELLSAGPAALALVQGNPWILTTLGSELAVRILGREMLTNPYFQTIAGKLVNNFNSGSVKAIETSIKQVQEFMTRKHPNEDWSFLTSEPTD